MYIPKHFQLKDEEIIYDFIEKYSFATLFSQHNGEPYATHLPLTLNKGESALYGHFARPNEQWKDIEYQQVLAVFQGPHSYISPSWYETTMAVPTWNYVSIHLYGKMQIVKDQKVIFDSLNDMVNKYESTDSPYNLIDVDSRFIEGMGKGIVAFKIKITKIEAKAKLSQNHPVERQELIVKHLENTSQQDNIQVASLMKKNLQK
ncbi:MULTISPECIES: FMN-binding negative transcriptional regulator [unclassified Bacillus (in: firmicutes)]|uniref:FMN-binding negative transcriptional regulator n=1 Tax=unclassified Bacillus (in: firmicutes) TaxID=185979 RepID=UPI001BEC6500|nr:MULTISPECIES: FMN-binding negative transcriptional regulator [unclassified Bacillus (in: firmicutes)]MBT2619061.1 FMN-binding negative transcriptional regulator [Bacillus sp. ISL-78]MBT2632491.1 FMN-binding negative transcriptional regulator [Bacillus sp. ISL-101]MBT2716423.1 FMN-binding negative transcriptional regulator [Bacillus sp. ISL-57]